MESSSISKLISWCREHCKIIGILFLIILLLSAFIWISSINNTATVKITPPEDHFSIGNMVESQVKYKVSNSVILSVDAASEVISAVSGLNKISAISNDLIGIAKEAQSQSDAKGIKELIIPTNAWCGANVDGYATYDWIETSTNYLYTTQHKQSHKVIIVKSMGFHMISKTFGWDVYAFEVLP